jgi:hypothetical protein
VTLNTKQSSGRCQLELHPSLKYLSGTDESMKCHGWNSVSTFQVLLRKKNGSLMLPDLIITLHSIWHHVFLTVMDQSKLRSMFLCGKRKLETKIVRLNSRHID